MLFISNEKTTQQITEIKIDGAVFREDGFGFQYFIFLKGIGIIFCWDKTSMSEGYFYLREKMTSYFTIIYDSLFRLIVELNSLGEKNDLKFSSEPFGEQNFTPSIPPGSLEKATVVKIEKDEIDDLLEEMLNDKDD